ncbi:MAG: hypothetical protein ACRD1G_17940, partial [Acidimicrobiales bacterium]
REPQPVTMAALGVSTLNPAARHLPAPRQARPGSVTFHDSTAWSRSPVAKVHPQKKCQLLY